MIELSAGRRLMTPSQVAAVLGVAKSSVYAAILSKTLPALRVSQRLRVDSRDVDEAIDRAKATGEPVLGILAKGRVTK